MGHLPITADAHGLTAVAAVRATAIRAVVRVQQLQRIPGLAAVVVATSVVLRAEPVVLVLWLFVTEHRKGQ